MYDPAAAAFSWMIFPTYASSSSTAACCPKARTALRRASSVSACKVLGLYLERPREKVGPWAALVGASDTAT